MHNSELEIYRKALDEVAYVLITDDKGSITYVNDKYCKLTNCTREELTGQEICIFKSGYYTGEFIENLYKEIEKGNISKNVFKYKTKDGSVLWLDTTILPLSDENKRPERFFTVMFDITNPINNIELKEEYRTELSHEIRTPLHGLLSMVDLLSETGLNHEQNDYISYIKETSTHLEHLINDLLLAIKIDSDEFQFESVPLNINHLVVSLVELSNLQKSIKDIHYLFRIDQNIPPALLGDPIYLRQILVNLLDNALKGTEKGTVMIQVKPVEVTSDKQTVEFQVSATDSSISIDKQKEIHERLTFAHEKSTRLFGESGMSMIIVKKLIVLQKGTFSYEIIDGTGYVFTFRIPYKKDTKINEFTQPPTVSTGQQLTKYKILIAEDDKINQLIYKKQMLKFNFDYKLAEDGFKTLELLQQESFDLILLDMQMPGMNGDEVLQKIRNELPEPTRHIPVICVSATIQPEIINTLMETGADAYLTKPYKENELIEIIEKTLSNVSLVKEANQPNQSTAVNLDPLNQFAHGDVDFILEILEYFRSNTPIELESMQQNFKTNNAELSGQLHKYRSQVSLLGLDKLTRLTLTLETALNETNSFEPFQNDFKNLLVLSQEAIVDVARLIIKFKTEHTL